eukprot:4401289-Alexandrium_andersonii.AAC.1
MAQWPEALRQERPGCPAPRWTRSPDPQKEPRVSRHAVAPVRAPTARGPRRGCPRSAQADQRRRRRPRQGMPRRQPASVPLQGCRPERPTELPPWPRADCPAAQAAPAQPWEQQQAQAAQPSQPAAAVPLDRPRDVAWPWAAPWRARCRRPQTPCPAAP